MKYFWVLLIWAGASGAWITSGTLLLWAPSMMLFAFSCVMYGGLIARDR